MIILRLILVVGLMGSSMSSVNAASSESYPDFIRLRTNLTGQMQAYTGKAPSAHEISVLLQIFYEGFYKLQTEHPDSFKADNYFKISSDDEKLELLDVGKLVDLSKLIGNERSGSLVEERVLILLDKLLEALKNEEILQSHFYHSDLSYYCDEESKFLKSGEYLKSTWSAVKGIPSTLGLICRGAPINIGKSIVHWTVIQGAVRQLHQALALYSEYERKELTLSQLDEAVSKLLNAR
jgi:hypothetical protein